MKKKYKTLSKRLVLGTANLGTYKYGINKYKISNKEIYNIKIPKLEEI